VTALVFDLARFRRTGKSDEQRAREGAHEQLAGKVTDTVLAQAKARAVRSVVGGRPVAEAIYTAVAWAKFAVHTDESQESA
jgi:hypothetical protein